MDPRETDEARRKQTIFDAALTLLLDRAGGSLTFTEAQYQAVAAKYGGVQTAAIRYEVHAKTGDEESEVMLQLTRKATENREPPT